MKDIITNRFYRIIMLLLSVSAYFAIMIFGQFRIYEIFGLIIIILIVRPITKYYFNKNGKVDILGYIVAFATNISLLYYFN
jgi:hypothetical protein